MALTGNWVDKQNEVDDILAEDINDIAHAVIELENNVLDTEEELKMINEGGVE